MWWLYFGWRTRRRMNLDDSGLFSLNYGTVLDGSMIYDTHSLSQAVTGTFIYPSLSSRFARRLTGLRRSRSSSINAPVIELGCSTSFAALTFYGTLDFTSHETSCLRRRPCVSPSTSRRTGCHPTSPFIQLRRWPR
jgi:hypothetical protein